MAKGFVTCNGQIMTDSVFARGFIGQFEGVLLTTPTNTDSIGPKALLIRLPVPSVDRGGLSHCFKPENGIKLLEEAT